MSLFDDLLSKAGIRDSNETENSTATAIMGFINQQPGGLVGIVQRFREHGFAAEVESWLSTGQNIPLSPGSVNNVLGEEHVNALANKLNLPPGTASSIAAQLIPKLVDRASPNGELENSTRE